MDTKTGKFDWAEVTVSIRHHHTKGGLCLKSHVSY